MKYLDVLTSRSLPHQLGLLHGCNTERHRCWGAGMIIVKDRELWSIRRGSLIRRSWNRLALETESQFRMCWRRSTKVVQKTEDWCVAYFTRWSDWILSEDRWLIAWDGPCDGRGWCWTFWGRWRWWRPRPPLWQRLGVPDVSGGDSLSSWQEPLCFSPSCVSKTQ